jgi:hypothetical protein
MVVICTIEDGGYKHILRSIKEAAPFIGVSGTIAAIVFAFLAAAMVKDVPDTNARNKIYEQYTDAKFDDKDNIFTANNEKYSYSIEDGELKIYSIKYEDVN